MNQDEVDKSKIRDGLLDVFRSVRESPGSEYAPDRFIDYLVKDPKGERCVHNSFKGKRLFWRFIRRVELKFAICFSDKAIDSLMDLDEMVDRIGYLQRTPKSSRTVISNRLREPIALPLLIIVAVLSLLPLAIAYRYFSYFALLILIAPLCIISIVVIVHYRDKRHYKSLRARIELANTGRQATASPSPAP